MAWTRNRFRFGWLTEKSKFRFGWLIDFGFNVQPTSNGHTEIEPRFKVAKKKDRGQIRIYVE